MFGGGWDFHWRFLGVNEGCPVGSGFEGGGNGHHSGDSEDCGWGGVDTGGVVLMRVEIMRGGTYSNKSLLAYSLLSVLLSIFFLCL